LISSLFLKKKREISSERSSPSLGGDLVRDLSLVFFVPDQSRIIREGEISRGFLGKGKKSIDLESLVLLYQGEIIFFPSNQSYWKLW
jgi:hypothetical protein